MKYTNLRSRIFRRSPAGGLEAKEIQYFMEFYHIQIPKELHEKKLECKENKGSQYFCLNLTILVITISCQNRCHLCFFVFVHDVACFIWF